MDVTVVKFRQLIDMAIGSPEPGHVNFYALHCLLTCIAEKLNIIDEAVDYSKYEALAVGCSSAKGSHHDLQRLFGHVSRLCAGSNRDDNIENDSKGNAIDVLAKESSEPTKELVSVNEEIRKDSKSEMVSKILEPEPQDTDEVQPTPKLVTEAGERTESISPYVQSSAESVVSPIMSPKISVHVLDDRISRIEVAIQKFGLPDHFIAGVAIMKDQLELAIDQLLLLTVLTLSKNPDTHRVQQLFTLSHTLRSLRKANIYIDGSKRAELHDISSIDWRSSELQLNEEISEEVVLETGNPRSRDSGDMDTRRLELDGCQCYSLEKMLDQLMELKGDLCLLTNKVNELSARLLKQESQATLTLIQELQEQIREQKLSVVNIKDIQDRLHVRVTSNIQNIEELKKNVGDIIITKVDKSDLEIQLAEKVDYNQLQRKVSLDQMLEVQCRIDKRFCEVLRQISEMDKRYALAIESLKDTLGFAAIEGILQTFKEQTTKEVQVLHRVLQNYINSTNDDCAAAGARVKVLQDLACLSCDTTCVMRSMEKNKVGKLPNARATATLSPLITYELGSIRKSGTMGYYRKDEFPHAPDSWMKRQEAQATSRHAGGSHTTSTARERVDKVLLNRI